MNTKPAGTNGPLESLAMVIQKNHTGIGIQCIQKEWAVGVQKHWDEGNTCRDLIQANQPYSFRTAHKHTLRIVCCTTFNPHSFSSRVFIFLCDIVLSSCDCLLLIHWFLCGDWWMPELPGYSSHVFFCWVSALFLVLFSSDHFPLINQVLLLYREHTQHINGHTRSVKCSTHTLTYVYRENDGTC